MQLRQPPEHGFSALVVRSTTSVVIGAAFLIALLLGGEAGLAVLIAIIAAFAASEFYGLTRIERRLPNEFFGLTAVALMPFVAASWGSFGLMAVVAMLVLASLLWSLFFRQVRTADTAITVFGAVYVGFTLSHLVLIRELHDGVVLALATVVAVWANDILAYLVGSSIGRHKLAPRISPKKSWEGLAAGTLGTLAVWATVSLAGLAAVPLGDALAIGAVASLAAVVGDLAESRVKRDAGAKDSGVLLPGHGGFLDRFDSLILVSMATYYTLVFFGANGGAL